MRFGPDGTVPKNFEGRAIATWHNGGVLEQQPVDPAKREGDWRMVGNIPEWLRDDGGANHWASSETIGMRWLAGRTIEGIPEPLQVWGKDGIRRPCDGTGAMGDVRGDYYAYFDAERTKLTVHGPVGYQRYSVAVSIRGNGRLFMAAPDYPAFVYITASGEVRVAMVPAPYRSGIVKCEHWPGAAYPLAFSLSGVLYLAYQTDTLGFICHPHNDRTKGYRIAPPPTAAAGIFNPDVRVAGDTVTFGWSTDEGEFQQAFATVALADDLTSMTLEEPVVISAPVTGPTVEPTPPVTSAPTSPAAPSALDRLTSPNGLVTLRVTNQGTLVLTSGTQEATVWPLDTPAPVPTVPTPPEPDADELAIRLLYRELLKRDADPEGLAFYLGIVKAGMPLSEVREDILDSREYASLQGTAPVPQTPAPSGNVYWRPPQWWVNVTEDQLRSMRGDLGGMRVSYLGPDPKVRPTAPSDYVFTPTYMSLSATGRQAMRNALKARGYTHISVGPIWERGYPGFKGHNFLNDPLGYIALLRELIDDGLIPVIWLMPDGPFNVERGAPGSTANPIDWAQVERVLTPIYAMPEFQQVCKVAVFGWEVTDNGWVKTMAKTEAALAWFKRVVPNAYRYWHAAANNGAPCDYALDGDGCEGKAWRMMAPYLHGHFWQDGSFGGWHLAAGRDAASPADRMAQFLDNLRYDVNRIRGNHYQPGGLIGADGKLLDVIAGEYSAYFEYHGETEASSVMYGAAAMQVEGVRGFMDGGPGVRR